jgi:hypothetical protein
MKSSLPSFPSAPNVLRSVEPRLSLSDEVSSAWPWWRASRPQEFVGSLWDFILISWEFLGIEWDLIGVEWDFTGIYRI